MDYVTLKFIALIWSLFPNFYPYNVSINGISFATRTVNLHQDDIMMKFCNLFINGSVDFISGIK